MESKKLYGASTQMTPAVYKDFYKTYYNEKLKVFKIVAEIVGLIAIFSAFYILANGYGILWGTIALWIGAFLLFYPRMIYRKPYKNAKDNSQTTHFAFFENYMSEKTKSHIKTAVFSAQKTSVCTQDTPVTTRLPLHIILCADEGNYDIIPLFFLKPLINSSIHALRRR